MSNQVATAPDHTAVQVADPEEAKTAPVSAEPPQEGPPPAKTWGVSYTTAFKLFVVALIITGIVLGLTVGDLDSRIGDLLEWLDDNRAEGIAIYIALYATLTGVHHSCLCVCGYHIGMGRLCVRCSVLSDMRIIVPTNLEFFHRGY